MQQKQATEQMPTGEEYKMQYHSECTRQAVNCQCLTLLDSFSILSLRQNISMKALPQQCE
jgi:hypothetical protein